MLEGYLYLAYFDALDTGDNSPSLSSMMMGLNMLISDSQGVMVVSWFIKIILGKAWKVSITSLGH